MNNVSSLLFFPGEINVLCVFAAADWYNFIALFCYWSFTEYLPFYDILNGIFSSLKTKSPNEVCLEFILFFILDIEFNPLLPSLSCGEDACDCQTSGLISIFDSL